jgi:4-diphosphocytidyl-2-C-methyl-D-erythritol kinase
VPEVAHELARAKLTRSLCITGRRDDGYHLLESEMVSLDLADELTIRAGDGLVVTDAIEWVGGAPDADSSRVQIPSDESNLVRVALSAVGRSAEVTLVKRIPAGAGLGGGSSDAAALLRWAGVRDLSVASKIGADVPFCLTGGRAVVRGTGEILEMTPYEDLWFVIVTPAIHIPTPAVYAAWDEMGGPTGENGNDLEPAAVSVEPRLGWWRGLLGSVTGASPRLAGSGASWFIECAGATESKTFEAALTEAALRAGERALVRSCHTTPAS